MGNKKIDTILIRLCVNEKKFRIYGRSFKLFLIRHSEDMKKIGV